jgi:solute carrier family 13 (sodium-dependent dicarboxylate transporter), member 2/3/5
MNENAISPKYGVRHESALAVFDARSQRPVCDGRGGNGWRRRVAAAVSMGSVLEATKGIDLLTHLVFTSIQPYLTSLLSTTIILYWAGFVYHFFLASEISMLATSIPLVVNFAKTEGMSPLLLGMIWTFAAGGKLFAYQSGVLIVGYSYGYFEARDLLRLGWWLTLVEFAILLLLVQVYWPLIGIS